MHNYCYITHCRIDIICFTFMIHMSIQKQKCAYLLFLCCFCGVENFINALRLPPRLLARGAKRSLWSCQLQFQQGKWRSTMFRHGIPKHSTILSLPHGTLNLPGPAYHVCHVLIISKLWWRLWRGRPGATRSSGATRALSRALPGTGTLGTRLSAGLGVVITSKHGTRKDEKGREMAKIPQMSWISDCKLSKSSVWFFCFTALK